MGALQHLKELVLIDAPLTTASYLNPLPPNLTKLTFEKQWHNSASLDLSAALCKQTHPGNHTGPQAEQQLVNKWWKPAVPARRGHAA